LPLQSTGATIGRVPSDDDVNIGGILVVEVAVVVDVVAVVTVREEQDEAAEAATWTTSPLYLLSRGSAYVMH
jgi:hypothetical protein